MWIIIFEYEKEFVEKIQFRNALNIKLEKIWVKCSGATAIKSDQKINHYKRYG